jgi:hypothetical protein
MDKDFSGKNSPTDLNLTLKDAESKGLPANP